MSGFISFSFLEEAGEEVYALLAKDVVENLGLVIDGVALSYEEHKRLQSQVRQAIAQAITEYDPHAEKTDDRRGKVGPRGRLGVSVRGLQLPDEVTEHVELRVQQELSKLLPNLTAGLRAHPRERPIPEGPTRSCIRPLPDGIPLAIDSSLFEAKFRNIPQGESRTLEISHAPVGSGYPSTGIPGGERLMITFETRPAPSFTGPPVPLPDYIIRVTLASNLPHLADPELNMFNTRGLHVWRCGAEDPRRPGILEPSGTRPFLSVTPIRPPATAFDDGVAYKPSVPKPRRDDLNDPPPGLAVAANWPIEAADTIALVVGPEDELRAYWDLSQFWPLHQGRRVTYRWLSARH